MKHLCIIIMGSSSDKKHAEEITAELDKFEINFTVRIGSAHKTPHHVLKIIEEYESIDCPKVYITIAGRSNALSGFVDACVSSPTIACPPKSESFAGADIFSSLRMPSGVCPTTILEPKNAALLTAKILGLNNIEMRAKITEYMKANADKILNDDIALNQ